MRDTTNIPAKGLRPSALPVPARLPANKVHILLQLLAKLHQGIEFSEGLATVNGLGGCRHTFL